MPYPNDISVNPRTSALLNGQVFFLSFLFCIVSRNFNYVTRNNDFFTRNFDLIIQKFDQISEACQLSNSTFRLFFLQKFRHNISDFNSKCRLINSVIQYLMLRFIERNNVFKPSYPCPALASIQTRLFSNVLCVCRSSARTFVLTLIKCEAMSSIFIALFLFGPRREKTCLRGTSCKFHQ